MGVRKIFEVAQDGPSVIIWEAAHGTRITYWTEQMAATATSFLVEKSNQFHDAQERARENEQEDERMAAVNCYGDVQMSEFQFVRNFVARAVKAGYETDTGLVRAVKEYW